MSFSTEVKKELSELENLSDKACVKAELIGYLSSANVTEERGLIRFSTENEYNINRFSKLLNNVNIFEYNIELIGKKFVITIPRENSKTLREAIKNGKLEEKENKAYVRGAFLGGGTINNPKNNYHMEVKLKNIQFADEIINLLNEYNINLKMLKSTNKNTNEANNQGNNKCRSKTRADDYILIYTKDGEEISKFLAFVEASKSVLKFEEIRVIRDMRNNINRIVNCETANLSKTVGAAVKQIEAINKLKKSGKFNELPDNLKELAELRIANPEVSLAELGQMLKEPVGKSGVNYRLNTIIKLSQ